MNWTDGTTANEGSSTLGWDELENAMKNAKMGVDMGRGKDWSTSLTFTTEQKPTFVKITPSDFRDVLTSKNRCPACKGHRLFECELQQKGTNKRALGWYCKGCQFCITNEMLLKMLAMYFQSKGWLT